MSENSGFEVDIKQLVGAKVTRRDLLKAAAATGTVFALGGLAGCGGDSDTSTSPSSSAAPKSGGQLKVGLVGGSAKDTADTHRAATGPDIAIQWTMYEGLCEYAPDFSVRNVLAEEVTPNADATEWTVRLKPDLTWHDGKAINADDIVFTFQRIVDPTNPTDGAAGLGGLKPENVTKVDDLTAKFTYDAPFVIFGTDGLANRLCHLVPAGFDPTKPIGSGPFKYKSSAPGEQWVFSPFPDYHGQVPYVDELTYIEFLEPAARVNALLGGTVDAIAELPPAQLSTIESTAGFTLLNRKSGGWVPFTMRVDQKPFDDVRVRQAFRLIPNRDEMLANAYNNVGWIGNDMYSPFDPGYPSDLPQRAQDLEQAKSLLKQAGYGDGLSVELVTSDGIGNGAVNAATVFAEHAKAAGVDIKVRTTDVGVFYGERYLSWTFAMDWWVMRNYLQQATAGSTPDAPYNETHWDNEAWLAIVKEALTTADDAKRNEMVREAATIEYNEGGYVIASFKNQLDAHSDKLGGIVQDDVSGNALGRYRLNGVYFL